MAEMNRQAIALLHEIRNEYENEKTKMIISGCIGPRGDGYNPAALMREDEAEQYHAMQAQVFRDADADMVTAITMTYAAEAIGLTRAAKNAGMPVVISFTVETDGRLPTGQALEDAIAEVDEATAKAPCVLHDQLCPSDSFRRRAGGWLPVVRTNPRSQSQRFDQESCRARRGQRTR